jgi:hypothetical protein
MLVMSVFLRMRKRQGETRSPDETPFTLSVGPALEQGWGRSRRASGAKRFDFARCADYAQRERSFQQNGRMEVYASG